MKKGRPEITDILLNNICEIMKDSCNEVSSLSEEIDCEFSCSMSKEDKKEYLFNTALNRMNDEIHQLQRTRNFVIEALGNQSHKI